MMDELTKIGDDCNICRRNQTKPRRFKLTVGTEEFRFNHTVLIDTMYIDSKPVLHLVDESTHYVAACFLKSQSANDIWKAIMRLWILAYMGPPDYLYVDQGSSYISKEMRANAEAAGIELKEAPIENPGSIGTVERYHAPLRRAYNKIRQSLDKGNTTNAECLQMAVYSNNTTIGPEGLCPMLLVYGAFPRPARTTPSPTQLERQNAIEAAKVEVQTEQARRRISFALNHPASEKNTKNSEALRDLPAGSPVLVYRSTTDKWEGPFRYISIEGETVVVQLPHGRRIFRSHYVRPWVNPLIGNKEPDDKYGTYEVNVDRQI